MAPALLECWQTWKNRRNILESKADLYWTHSAYVTPLIILTRRSAKLKILRTGGSPQNARRTHSCFIPICSNVSDSIWVCNDCRVLGKWVVMNSVESFHHLRENVKNKVEWSILSIPDSLILLAQYVAAPGNLEREKVEDAEPQHLFCTLFPLSGLVSSSIWCPGGKGQTEDTTGSGLCLALSQSVYCRDWTSQDEWWYLESELWLCVWYWDYELPLLIGYFHIALIWWISDRSFAGNIRLFPDKFHLNYLKFKILFVSNLNKLTK